MQTLIDDPRQVARAAGLRYVSDAVPGIRRRCSGRGFTYVAPDGRRVCDQAVLRRIRRLAIPPAWRDVWICPWPHGHLQATGRDEAGRKQYRYHEDWSRCRSETKFRHLIAFAEALAPLRRQIDRDLHRRTLDRRRVLAAAVRLLDLTLVRVGNAEYARQNGSYGLTTLRSKHMSVNGREMELCFVGKSGQRQCLSVEDPRVACVVRRCHELPGQLLFQYLDERGERRPIDSGDVNDYLREGTGRDVTAKDFRTWGGTVLAAVTLARFEPTDDPRQIERNVIETVKAVALRIGNRPATCRMYYIHPVVFDAYREGRLSRSMNARPRPERPVPRLGLSAEETAVLRLLRRAARKA